MSCFQSKQKQIIKPLVTWQMFLIWCRYWQYICRVIMAFSGPITAITHATSERIPTESGKSQRLGCTESSARQLEILLGKFSISNSDGMHPMAFTILTGARSCRVWQCFCTDTWLCCGSFSLCVTSVVRVELNSTKSIEAKHVCKLSYHWFR